MSHNKNHGRAEVVRKARHRNMVSGSTKQIRDAAGRGLMASAMRHLERGAALETDERKAKRPRGMSTKARYKTASAALDAMHTGAITLALATQIADRIEGEVAELRRALVAAARGNEEGSQDTNRHR